MSDAEDSPPVEQLFEAAFREHSAGRLSEAEGFYRGALAEDPGHAPSLHGLGLIALQRDRAELALDLIARAIAIDGAVPSYHSNLAIALRRLGRLEEAIASYRTAIVLDPAYAEAHHNLGLALKSEGKVEDAIACYRRAIALNPAYADARNNLGSLLFDLGRLEESAAELERAVALDPGLAEAHVNLGNVRQDQGRLAEAVALNRAALSLKPNSPEAFSNLGNALRRQGSVEAAIAAYEQAISLRTDYSEAHSNLLFAHAARGLPDPVGYLALARRWEESCFPTRGDHAGPTKIEPLAGRRLRIAYVSGDFRQHAVSYFCEQLFARHDRSRIELFAYSTSPRQDAVTERLRGLSEHWISLFGLSDEAAHARILADGIDVLIDLSGHTAGNRLGVLARRSAPVQVHYLGFFASTGLSTIDYWIGDAILTPPETDAHFRESVWRLPRIWVSYDAQEAAPPPSWRPAADGTLWLGSFNNLGKLTPETIALWSRVLQALPEGRLLLKTAGLADAANRGHILDAFRANGVDVRRIELVDRSVTPDWRQHMAYYERLDVALDPVGGIAGGTTTCDALWMGVPVIGLAGDRMATRMTASMLDAIGRPEWIARDADDYVEKVIGLARDRERRRALRFEQRGRMAASPLCDAAGLARALEAAFNAMHEAAIRKAAASGGRTVRDDRRGVA